MRSATLTTLALSSLTMHAADYSPAIPRLEAVTREEMETWGIGGVAVALVDDQETVYVKGFGEAAADSLFRVGSISTLFNAIAVMQQVEAGKLELHLVAGGPLTPALKDQDKGLPGITFHGWLKHEEVQDVAARCHVLAFPSIREFGGGAQEGPLSGTDREELDNSPQTAAYSIADNQVHDVAFCITRINGTDLEIRVTVDGDSYAAEQTVPASVFILWIRIRMRA